MLQRCEASPPGTKVTAQIDPSDREESAPRGSSDVSRGKDPAAVSIAHMMGTPGRRVVTHSTSEGSSTLGIRMPATAGPTASRSAAQSSDLTALTRTHAAFVVVETATLRRAWALS